jgi:hypothetical protein
MKTIKIICTAWSTKSPAMGTVSEEDWHSNTNNGYIPVEFINQRGLNEYHRQEIPKVYLKIKGAENDK